MFISQIIYGDLIIMSVKINENANFKENYFFFIFF